MSGGNPKTSVEAIRVFSDEGVALNFMAGLRWGSMEKACCPRCGSIRVRFISTRRVWECREKHVGQPKRFSIKTNTVMEDSPLPLGTWLVAIWLEANAKNSISSYELHRSLGITQKSAWFMQQRIRLAMQSGDFFKQLTGTVEVDETYIGGLARNMHAKRRKRVVTGTGGAGKAVVMGLLERHGEVRTVVVENNSGKTLKPIVRRHVTPGAMLMTDQLGAYNGLDAEYVHGVINHAECYVRGTVHTNGLENFWSLFKRCIKGTHISVEPFHLFRYLDAETYRFNNRKMDDCARFLGVVQSMAGKRLTYKTLIGQEQSEPLS